MKQNKNRTNNRMAHNRLQLPLGQLGYGSIKRITYPDGNVNTHSIVQVFEGVIDVGVSEKGAFFYGMSNIKRVTGNDGKYLDLLSRSTSAYSDNSSNDRIPQNGETVNTHSMQNSGNDAKRQNLFGEVGVFSGIDAYKLGKALIGSPDAGSVQFDGTVPGASIATRYISTEEAMKLLQRNGVKVSKAQAENLKNYHNQRAELAHSIARAFGVNVQFGGVEKGALAQYERSTNTIYLNPAEKVSVMRQLAEGHELLHALEQTKNYKALSNLVIDGVFGGVNSDAYIAEASRIDARYKRAGENLTPEELRQEVVAEYFRTRVFKNAETLQQFITDNYKTMGQSFVDILKQTAAKVQQVFGKTSETAVPSMSQQVLDSLAVSMNQARKDANAQIRSDRLDAVAEGYGLRNVNSAQMPNDNQNSQNLFIGLTDNNESLLHQAISMKESGSTAAEIKAKTNWHVGADGKWRFEISDADSTYEWRGDIDFKNRHPEYARYRDLQSVYAKQMLELDPNAKLTDDEMNEYRRLSDVWSDAYKTPGKVTADSPTNNRLSDYFNHDKLYQAYPFMKDIEIEFISSTQDGFRGRYNADENKITINSSLSHSEQKSTLLHEIQHAIQHHEGFSTGASPQYWSNHKYEFTYKEKSDLKNISSEKAEIIDNLRKGWGHDAVSDAFDYWSLNDTYFDDNIDTDAVDRELEGIETRAKRKGYSELLDAYYDVVSREQFIIKNADRRQKRSDYDLYSSTAGEIEARQVQARKDMNDDERKGTMPFVRDMQAVFAEKSDIGYNTDKTFAEQVDEVLTGTFDRYTDVYVGKLPKILESVGLDSKLPMLALASYIRDANKPKNTKRHHHGLTATQIKSIPEKISNPVMIMDSLDAYKNSIVVVTDMVDIDNSPIIVSIKSDGSGRNNRIKVESNFLTGYYGRDGFANFIKNNAKENTFLYINKEKAIALETKSSTSWLEELRNYDFDIIIRQKRKNVKRQSLITQESLSESEQDYIPDEEFAEAARLEAAEFLEAPEADTARYINERLQAERDKFDGTLKHVDVTRLSDTAYLKSVSGDIDRNTFGKLKGLS